MQNTFTIGEAISYGWSKFKGNAGFLALLTLALFVVSGLVGAADRKSAVMGILSVAVNFFTAFTLTRVAVAACAEKEFRAGDIFKLSWLQFGSYALATILSGALNLIGFLALIVPGIILSVRLGYFGYAVAGEDAGPIEAIKRSWSLTRGNFWKLLGFAFVLGFLNIAGMIPVGLGLLVTIPITFISMAFVYEKLKALPAVAPAEPLPAEVQKP